MNAFNPADFIHNDLSDSFSTTDTSTDENLSGLTQRAIYLQQKDNIMSTPLKQQLPSGLDTKSSEINTFDMSMEDQILGIHGTMRPNEIGGTRLSDDLLHTTPSKSSQNNVLSGVDSAKISELQIKITKLEAELQEKRADYMLLQSEFNEATEGLEIAEEEIAKLKAGNNTNAELLKQIKDAENKIKDFDEQLARVNTENARRLALKDEDLERIENQMLEAVSKNSQVSAEVRTLKDKMSSVQRLADERSMIISTKEQRISELMKLKDEADKKIGQLEAKVNLVESSGSQRVLTVQSELDKTKEEFVQVKKDFERLMKEQNEVISFSTFQAGRDMGVTPKKGFVKLSVRDLENILADLESHDSMLTTTKTQLQAAENSLMHARQKIKSFNRDELDDRIAFLEGENESLKKEIRNNETLIKNVNQAQTIKGPNLALTRVEFLQNHVKELKETHEEEINSIKAENQQFFATFRRQEMGYKKEIHNLKIKNSQLKSVVDENRTTIEQLHVEIVGLQKEKESLLGQRDNAISLLEGQKKKVSTLENDLSLWKRKHGEITRQYENVVEQIKNDEEKMYIQSELDKKERIIQDYQQKTIQMREKYTKEMNSLREENQRNITDFNLQHHKDLEDLVNGHEENMRKLSEELVKVQKQLEQRKFDIAQIKQQKSQLEVENINLKKGMVPDDSPYILLNEYKEKIQDANSIIDEKEMELDNLHRFYTKKLKEKDENIRVIYNEVKNLINRAHQLDSRIELPNIAPIPFESPMSPTVSERT
eukprot:TRINITY_DN3179_c0_g1_i1.p1 TRINITY_DN3179_c0_g1~~TRINITY_DN3179_c0_g1_i1.p1  ORF type:complete len:853 (-),score=229.65 TRINITY_DN3179_c0_g1_i1:100-2409(-)